MKKFILKSLIGFLTILSSSSIGKGEGFGVIVNENLIKTDDRDDLLREKLSSDEVDQSKGEELLENVSGRMKMKGFKRKEFENGDDDDDDDDLRRDPRIYKANLHKIKMFSSGNSERIAPYLPTRFLFKNGEDKMKKTATKSKKMSNLLSNIQDKVQLSHKLNESVTSTKLNISNLRNFRDKRAFTSNLRDVFYGRKHRIPPRRYPELKNKNTVYLCAANCIKKFGRGVGGGDDFYQKTRRHWYRKPHYRRNKFRDGTYRKTADDVKGIRYPPPPPSRVNYLNRFNFGNFGIIRPARPNYPCHVAKRYPCHAASECKHGKVRHRFVISPFENYKCYPAWSFKITRGDLFDLIIRAGDDGGGGDDDDRVIIPAKVQYRRLYPGGSIFVYPLNRDLFIIIFSNTDDHHCHNRSIITDDDKHVMSAADEAQPDDLISKDGVQDEEASTKAAEDERDDSKDRDVFVEFLKGINRLNDSQVAEEFLKKLNDSSTTVKDSFRDRLESILEGLTAEKKEPELANIENAQEENRQDRDKVRKTTDLKLNEGKISGLNKEEEEEIAI